MQSKKIDYFYVVNSIISLIIMFGFGYLEPFGAITPNGMRILGIFLSLIYGWTTVGTLWPSMIGILAMGFTEGVTVNTAIKMPWGMIQYGNC